MKIVNDGDDVPVAQHRACWTRTIYQRCLGSASCVWRIICVNIVMCVLWD